MAMVFMRAERGADLAAPTIEALPALLAEPSYTPCWKAVGRPSCRPKRIERVSDPRGGVAVAVELGRVFGEARGLQHRSQAGRIGRVDERVSAGEHGVDPFRRGPQRDAGDAQPVRLLLQAAGI